MKKIAFSSKSSDGLDADLSEHFGRCPFFTLVEVDDREVLNVTVIENPHYQSHSPGVIPSFINEQNVNLMVAGGMGHRAVDFFNNFGIEVATGFSGKISDIVKLYFDGKVEGFKPCSHGEHSGNCH